MSTGRDALIKQGAHCWKMWGVYVHMCRLRVVCLFRVCVISLSSVCVCDIYICVCVCVCVCACRVCGH